MPSVVQPAFRPDQISGWEAQLPSIQAGITVKAILNEEGIAFFNRKTEHREVKLLSLSYEDDYKGNALAAMCSREKFEIRRHGAFSAERVRALVAKIRGSAGLRSYAGTVAFSYGGEPI